jgi:predicted RNase H-like HicB family nuclease
MTTLSVSVAPRRQVATEPQGRVVRITWRHQSPPSHEFEAIACPEEDGGYSAFAVHYPGVISQGDTLDEVKENIAEAFLAMLESRRKHGEGLEFSNQLPVDAPAGSHRLRIKVDA